MLNPNIEISANPDAFNGTSEARNFTGAAIQRVEDVLSKGDLALHASSAGLVVRGGDASSATSGDAVGSEDKGAMVLGCKGARAQGCSGARVQGC